MKYKKKGLRPHKANFMNEKPLFRGFNMGVYRFPSISEKTDPQPIDAEEFHWQIAALMAYLRKSVILKNKSGEVVEIVGYTPATQGEAFPVYYSVGGFYTTKKGEKRSPKKLWRDYKIEGLGETSTKSIYSPSGQLMKIRVYPVPSENYGLNDSWKPVVEYMSSKGRDLAFKVLSAFVGLFPGHEKKGWHDWHYERQLTVYIDNHYILDRFSPEEWWVVTRKTQARILPLTEGFTISSIRLDVDQGWA